MARKKRKESIFEKKVAENLTDIMKDLNPEIQEAHRYQARNFQLDISW